MIDWSIFFFIIQNIPLIFSLYKVVAARRMFTAPCILDLWVFMFMKGPAAKEEFRTQEDWKLKLDLFYHRLQIGLGRK